jgi:hypothetical protein
MEPSVATREIAAEAARLVVETGLEYAAAKSKAARALGRGAGARTEMPANELVEDEVRAYLELYCDDPKAAELHLMDLGIAYDVDTLDPSGPRPRDVLTVSSPCRELGERVTVHLLLHDYDELRGALKPDARGRTWRGDLAALRRRLLEQEGGAA